MPSLDRDFSSLMFFEANYHFIREVQPSGDVPIIVNQITWSLFELDQGSAEPNIWTPVDAYGKSFYSSVLADLGQAAGPNILSSETLLEQYTRNFSSFHRTANAKPGPATQSYDELKAQTGPLSIVPSTIYQQYICEVPAQKSTGSLIIAVVVADIVVLQTLWKVVTVAMTYIVAKRDTTAMYCAGCSSLSPGAKEANESRDTADPTPSNTTAERQQGDPESHQRGRS